ncbi:MAG: hypothetical protein WEA80_11350 [Gemmatimonadaceae bacterium]
MSERRKTHNGRDLSGHFRVKQVDVEDLKADRDGVDFIEDDVRLGGAVADTGPNAGQRGVRIHELIKKDHGKKKRPTKGK